MHSRPGIEIQIQIEMHSRPGIEIEMKTKMFSSWDENGILSFLVFSKFLCDAVRVKYVGYFLL
jgi:hypothetical protein